MNALTIRNHPQRSDAGAERGVAILELALMLPILVVIVLAGLEHSRALKYVQISSAVSRELATFAYRECVSHPSGDPRNVADALGADPPPPSATGWNGWMDQCMKSVVNEIIGGFVANTVPSIDVDVSLSIFRFCPDPSDASCTGIDPVAFTATGASPGASGTNTYDSTSRFSLRLSPAQVDYVSQSTPLSARDYIVAGEAFVSYDPMFSDFLTLFHFNPGEFYDATVL